MFMKARFSSVCTVKSDNFFKLGVPRAPWWGPGHWGSASPVVPRIDTDTKNPKTLLRSVLSVSY